MALDTWLMQPGWAFLDEFGVDQYLDKMGEAGIVQLAIGAPFPVEPDPGHYDGTIKGCPLPDAVKEKKEQVGEFLDTAGRRGFHIWAYGTNPHMSGSKEVYDRLHIKHVLQPDGSVAAVDSYWGACVNGPEFLPYYLGRIRDVQHAFPQVAGFFNDGPEFGYEIAAGFMDDNLNLFGCFGRCCENKAAELGYDFAALRQAAATLMQWFHAVDAAAVERMLEHPDSPARALAAAAGDERIADWLAFKRDSIVSFVEQLCAGVKELDADLQMGVGSRLPAFTPLTGYDLGRLASHADFLLPKIYLWMGGVDGLYGTVYRWLRTLKTLNPELPEEVSVRFVYRLFGFELPGVDGVEDILRHIEPCFADGLGLTHLGAPFPREFFSDVLAEQVRLMIAQVGEAARVRPWTHTHHSGRVLTPDEMDQALTAAHGAGLTTYLNYLPVEPGNWEVAVKHGAQAPG